LSSIVDQNIAAAFLTSTGTAELSRDQFIRITLPSNVSFVDVVNRQDCCQSRLDGVVLTIVNGTLNYTTVLPGSTEFCYSFMSTTTTTTAGIYRDPTTNNLFYYTSGFLQKYPWNVYQLNGYPNYTDITDISFFNKPLLATNFSVTASSFIAFHKYYVPGIFE
jgi:hypothetical protein